MESTIVIKVKYGETLRRFNARVVEEQLDLDMVRLREKIHGLFNFAHDADLTLTYIDEDGDVVTLADEDDLCDVVRQSLNPLRISVRLNPEKTGRSYARSSRNSTPMRSPQGQQHPMQNFNTSVSEILKSVPEPLREVFSKLSADLSSKASSSGPGVTGIAELLDTFSKLGLAYLSKNINVQAGEETSAFSAASESTLVASDMKGQSVMKVAVTPEEKLSGTKPGASTSKDNQSPLETSSIGKEVGLKKVVHGVDDTAFLLPGFPSSKASSMPVERHIASKNEEFKGLGLNMRMPGATSESIVGASDIKSQPLLKVVVAPQEMFPGPNPGASTLKNNQSPLETSLKSKEVGFKKVPQGVDDTAVLLPVFPSSKASSIPEESRIASKNDEVDGYRWNMWKPSGEDVPTVAPKDFFKSKQANGDGTGFGTSNPDYLKRCLQDSQTMGMDTGLSAKPIESDSSSAWHYGLNSSNESAIPLDTYLSMPHMQPYYPRVAPFKRSYNHEDGVGSIFHRGVRCDGCGVHPIAGPRYKSKVKDDYDLCSVCFGGMGNESDYIRMDRPWAPRLPFKGMHDPTRIRPPSMPQGGFRVKSTQTKLDSRFIQDVNVLDGTIMAPLTPFTKIWRMRNNGNTIWPQGSQLLWIGGDKLSEALALEVEIPAEGLAVDRELDIAVDFVAPDLPGHYVSYWSMASSSGQKFGQHVWVLIQVDASLKDTSEVINSLNLNLPPISSGLTAPEMDNMKVDPLVEGSFPEPYSSSNRVTELIEPTVDAQLKKDPELSFPINDTLLVGGASSNVNPGPSSVSYPVVDFSPVSFPVELAPANVQGSAVEEVNVNTDREEFLLRELEDMGFKQVDLNKEILRMNDYDLEQSVDALCGVSEWDPILEELKEMGFCDDETNKRLLKKNNGSIKRVVMDLITGEKA